VDGNRTQAAAAQEVVVDDMDEIVQEFVVESHENLDQLDQDLVQLERDPGSRDLLASVFRTIHTIKGTSGFLAFSRLESLTHVGENLLARLRDGTIAVAITYDLGLNPVVEFAPLAPAPPYALLPADHRLAGADSAELADLANDPFLLLDLPLSRNYFLGLYRAAGIEPTVARRVADPELVRSLVAWGYGYTLANARPEPVRAVDGTPIRALPLRGGPPPPRVGLARRAGLEPTRTATAFADTCTDVLATRWVRE